MLYTTSPWHIYFITGSLYLLFHFTFLTHPTGNHQKRNSFLKDFIYLFLERGRGGEREGEKQQCGNMVASHTLPTGDLACNPGMCPDWESNKRPFGLQADTQSTEPHQPGQKRNSLLLCSQMYQFLLLWFLGLLYSMSKNNRHLNRIVIHESSCL